MVILNNVDSIVILTWSDWFSELRSNRYHYATRFAKIKPVIFVQPDLTESRYFFEETGIGNIIVLHISNKYDDIQQKLLNSALAERGCLRPLFWIYNCYFHSFLAQHYSVLNIYHGTEDYLASDSRIKFQDSALIDAYLKTLSKCQLIIAVSEGVKKSFEQNVDFEGEIVTVNNGCDYSFYCPIKNHSNTKTLGSKIAFYQGNIFDKLDYDLLLKLTKILPDWTFNFCGKVLFDEEGWQVLRKQPNVNYLGLLSPEEIRLQSYVSTVGLIPFVQSEWLVVRSFPLKTFEYLATGLPVVSIPIASILNFSDVIQFAETAEEFALKINQAAILRSDPEHFEKRLKIASQQDYDLRFQEALQHIENAISSQKSIDAKLSIGILYESLSVKISTIEEHLNSFALFSKHHISYISACQGVKCTVDLDVFDILVIHYSVRVSVRDSNWMLSTDYVNAVKNFRGYKILFIQDEYEGTNIAHAWITELGIHTVYSCVPEQYKEMIYPTAKFPYVNFISTLTGYVPITKSNHKKYTKTLERPILIGYRGRALPYWYGTLGQDKLEIGIKIKEYCLSKNLPIDIEWEDSKRIYGQDWYQFMMRCRATLGTESGSNVFDFDGTIRAEIEKKLENNPNLSFDDIYETDIKPYEKIRMNQISPKIFEAILFKTALILLEGEYSGILIPRVHYIPLKKDFSNLEEVIEKVQNDELINEITQKAYDDIIQSNQYSYEKFIADFDETLSCLIGKKLKAKNKLCFFHYPESKKIDHEEISGLMSATVPSSFALTLDEINKHQDDFNEKEKLKNKPTLAELVEIIKDSAIKAFKKRILLAIEFKPMRIILRFIPRPIKSVVKKLIFKQEQEIGV